VQVYGQGRGRRRKYEEIDASRIDATAIRISTVVWLLTEAAISGVGLIDILFDHRQHPTGSEVQTGRRRSG